MKKAVFAVVSAFLALALVAGPVAANPDSDAGVVVNATAVVSKGFNNVTEHGVAMTCANGTGGPIGIPVVNGPKKAYYDFKVVPPIPPLPAVGVSLNGGTITGMHVCGQIDPVAGVGAACGMSAGRNGNGWADTSGIAGTPDIRFNGLGWQASAGSLFLVTGGATGASKTAKSGVLALVSAKGVAGQCGNKQLNGKTGGMQFQVDFVYLIHPLIPVQKKTK